jgi:hypothetical protein
VHEPEYEKPARRLSHARPELYRWSSYRATAAVEAAPEWLALDRLAPFFGEAMHWQANFPAFVAEKIGSTERPWDRVRGQEQNATRDATAA